MDVKGVCYNNLGLYFENVSKENGNHIALKYEDQDLSYQSLNSLSNRIANFLIKKGVSKRDVVGILNTKEPVGYASMLACLKTGAIYTNIDEVNPRKRLKKIFKKADLKLLIADHEANRDIKESARELQIPLFYLDEKVLSKYEDHNLEITAEITWENPAYIMFTSGSTGTPKGALISHGNVLSFIDWSSYRFCVEAKDIFAQVSPIYFDNSVFDFYTALFCGATLAPIKKDSLQDPKRLVQSIDRLKCTILFSVPSLFLYLTTMKVLNPEDFTTVRIYSFGGEGYPKSELKKLYDLYAPHARFINVYGPTEGTCICSSHEVSPADFKNTESLPPLGKINKNFDYLILDEKGNSVNTGGAGELCLLGPGVGMGYYNDPVQTKKAFVGNPLQKKYHEKMYKTGDLVRVDANGLLWFIGRIDNQIKHMGYRIELEEIENALNTFPFVNQSAVVYKRMYATHGKIIAFISSKIDIEGHDIQLMLQDLLPAYMIPNVIELLEHLPKNSNGKIDKEYLKRQVRI